MAAAASLPEIVVQLFGVQALWVACIIGYLACFASLNIYIQSFARLVWSQAQYKPESYLARLSPPPSAQCAKRRIGLLRSQYSVHLYAANQSRCVNRLRQRHLYYDLFAVHVGGLSITERAHYRALAVIGGLLCLLLLAMVGWKSLYALIMLAGLWLFYPAGRIRQR